MFFVEIIGRDGIETTYNLANTWIISLRSKNAAEEKTSLIVSPPDNQFSEILLRGNDAIRVYTTIREGLKNQSPFISINLQDRAE